MKVKIRDWLMSIDDRGLMKIGEIIAKIIEIGFYVWIGVWIGYEIGEIAKWGYEIGKW